MSPAARGAILLAFTAAIWTWHWFMPLPPLSTSDVAVWTSEFILGISGVALLAYHFFFYRKTLGDDDEFDRNR